MLAGFRWWANLRAAPTDVLLDAIQLVSTHRVGQDINAAPSLLPGLEG